MRDIFKPALSLLIICTLVTFLVALTFYATENTIDTREKEALDGAMNEVLPNGAPFEEMETDSSFNDESIKLNGVYSSKEGYVFNITVQGYGGDVIVIIGINKNSEISGVRLGPNNETPSLGKKAEESAFTSLFEKLKTKENIAANVDTISGATITSSAVIEAVQKASNYYNRYQGGDG